MKKKKLVSMFIALVAAISLLGTSVYAANGPMGGQVWEDQTYYMAYICFLETDEAGQIVRDEDWNPVGKNVFAENVAVNEMENAAYDRATNTLTITNLSADNMIMETNVMGDDFTLKVVGDCSIGQIRVWGDNYGGSLHIEGDGTLNVNTNNIFDHAIDLHAERSDSVLEFGNKVKVNLFAREAVAVVSQVEFESAGQAFAFANGQNPAITKETNRIESTRWINGIEMRDPGSSMKAENDVDPSGIYGINPAVKSDDTEGYSVSKLVYSEKYSAYFQDHSFGEWGELFIKREDFPTSGYHIVYDGEDEVWLEIYDLYNTKQVYKEASGKEYVIGYEYDENGEKVEYAMDFEPIEELKDTYVYTKNTSVNVSELTPAYHVEMIEGVYDYTLQGTTFSYDGSDMSNVKTIKLVDIGNIWRDLTSTDYVPFTTEINPNEPGLTDQMEIEEEVWTGKKSVIKSTGAPAKCVAGDTYSYSITLRAKAGYVFDNEFTFIYGGSKPYNFMCTISADKKHMTLSHFVGSVTVAAPKTAITKATVSGIGNKVYTGKSLAQSIKVTCGGKTLVNGRDYTVAYSTNKNVGKATVTITGKGSYTGKITKTFMINPKGTSLSKLTAGKKKATAKWSKQTAQTDGYQIQYTTDSKFKKGTKTVTVKGAKVTSKTITKLTSKKKYYVRIRTYKKVGKTTYYSSWSKAKSVKIK